MEAIREEAIYLYIIDKDKDKEITQKKRSMRTLKTVLDSKFRLEVPRYDNIDHEILNSYRYSVLDKKMTFAYSLFKGLNYWYKCPAEILNKTAAEMSIAMKCSIMIDDIQDNSLLRRGSPCAHLIYGVANVLNTTGFLVSHHIYDFTNTDTAEEIVDCNDCLIDAIRGQAMEIYWRDNFICPTEEEYKLMASRKTGTFFSMCADWLKGKGVNKLYVNDQLLMESIGLFCQIFDDYQSLNDADYQETKGFCDDITEGKFSFPIIYVIRNYPEEGKIVLDILKERTRDIDRLKYCRAIIEKCGGLEYTKQAFTNYRKIIISETEKLGPNPIIKEEFFDRYLGGTALVA